MARSNKLEILENVLIEHGYSGWYVIEPSRSNPDNRVLLNPKEKKLGEISIPEKWLDDPSRRGTIEETLVSAIQNARYIIPQAHPQSSRLSRP